MRSSRDEWACCWEREVMFFERMSCGSLLLLFVEQQGFVVTPLQYASLEDMLLLSSHD